MKVSVIYDSVFGNTEKIARAMGQAPGDNSSVDIVHVSRADAEMIHETNLLIAGSPTRGFRPTPALAKYLKSLPKNHLNGLSVAAFDTRIDLNQIGNKMLRFMVHKGGYAAGRIARLLQKRGGSLIAAPEGFFVTGDQGPLKAGEPERAADWAEQLFQTVMNQRKSL